MDKNALSSLLWFILLLINVGAVLVGYMYYQDQLATTPFYLWIFVPDCPFYVLLFLLSFGLAQFSAKSGGSSLLGSISRLVRSDTFNFVVSIGLVKYALWTMFVLLFYSSTFFSPPYSAQSYFLFFAHIGMALECLLLLPKKVDMKMLGIALAWFLLNDVMDYFVGLYPYLPQGAEQFRVVMLLTFAASIVLSFSAYALGPKIAGNKLVLGLRALFLPNHNV